MLFVFILLILASGCTITGRVVDNKRNYITTNVEDKVEEKLETEEEVFVLVKLRDIEPQQEKVLSKLNLKEKKLLGILIEEPDLKLKHKYSNINAFSGKITKQGLEKLRNDPNVENIYIDKKFSIALDNSIPQINADDVWQIQVNSTNITGLGQTVCIVDTGVDYNHSDLGNGWGNKVIGGYRSLNNGADQQECSQNPSACFDDEGHGTHVAGIISSDNNMYKGVAPDAKIVAAKVLDSSGSGWASDIIAGIDWCIDNASIFNISVISISIGDKTAHNTYCNNDIIAPIINTAVGKNITVMISSGNCEGVSCTSGVSSPACVENATAIGAVNGADAIGYQRGALFELLAPGLSIHSTQLNGGFTDKSGTSMAAPHAAGAAALLQQFNKLQNGNSLTPAQIKETLNDTGIIIDDSGGSGYNFSRIDVYSAIQSLNNSYQGSNSCSESNITYFLEPYIMAWNETTEIIRLETNQAVNVTIEYGETTSYGSSINNSNFSTKHELMITNLTPDTLYYYKVTAINSSGIFCYKNSTFNSTFRTSQNSKTNFSFAVIGDSRGNSCGAIGNNFNSLISNITLKNVDFVIMTGDDIQAEGCSNDDSYWQGFHNITEVIRKNKTFLSTIGNHEDPYRSAARTAWRNYWIHPLNGDGAVEHWNETTFYWRYGNSLFISLNTEEPSDLGDIAGNQFNWFNETALTQSGYRHKFVFDHRPLVGSSRGGTLYADDPSRSSMIDNEMYAKNVTAAFYGHDHYYCYNTTQNGEMIHIITGGGGAPLYSTSTCLGTGFSQYHYVIVDVMGNTINGTVYNLTGDVIHSFSRVMNAQPIAANVILTSTDSLNRTNGTLQASWNFSDSDGDSQIDNETRWYNDSNEVASLANLTSITSGNITKNQTWIFSVRVYDGLNWSNWSNSSSITIQNADPELTQISNKTVNATDEVTISVNATDLDGDILDYSINDTNFNQTNNIFTWQTTVNDSGIHVVNITVTDNSSNVSQLVYIAVCLDSDGDGYNVTSNGCGTVDFNDTDADKYPGASCSISCYSGSTYDTGGTCTGGTYTCGGGGGGSSSSGTTYTAMNLETEEYKKILRRKDKIKFQFKSEYHSATVNAVTTDYVDVLVQSTPILVTVYEYATEKADIDNDDVYDLAITLNSISGSRADLTFKLIEEPIQEIIIAEEQEEIEIIEEPESIEEQPILEEPSVDIVIPEKDSLDLNLPSELSVLRESIFYIVLVFFFVLFIILFEVKKKKKRHHSH